MNFIDFQSPAMRFVASDFAAKMESVSARIARAHVDFMETHIKLAIRAAEGGELPPVLECAKLGRFIMSPQSRQRVFYWRDTPRLVFEHHGDFRLTVREPAEGEFDFSKQPS
jgi:hypothetical protein